MEGRVEIPFASLGVTRGMVGRYLGVPPWEASRDEKVRGVLDKFLGEASALLSPRGAYTTVLAEDTWLAREVPGEMLEGAKELALILTTIGESVEAKVAVLFKGGRFSEALALDAVASAASEAMMSRLYRQVKAAAARMGLSAGFLLSPGCPWFPLALQEEIYAYLPGGELDIGITREGILRPAKSLAACVPLRLPGAPNRGTRSVCKTCPRWENGCNPLQVAG